MGGAPGGGGVPGEGLGGLEAVADPRVEGVEDDEGCGRRDESVAAAEGEEFFCVVVGARGELTYAGGGPGGGEDGAGAGGGAAEGDWRKTAVGNDGGDGGFVSSEFAKDTEASLAAGQFLSDALDGSHAVAIQAVENDGRENQGMDGFQEGLDLEIDEATVAGLAEGFAVGVGLRDDGDDAAELAGGGAGESVDAVGEEEGEGVGTVLWGPREVGAAVIVEFFEVGDQGVCVGAVDGFFVGIAEDVACEGGGA